MPSDDPTEAPRAPRTAARTISREQVERIARLARLELGGAEAEAMTGHLGQILEYVATLEALDTAEVEPTAHPFSLQTPLRPDTPAAPMDPELALSNAPARDAWAFVVPKVLASDDEG